MSIVAITGAGGYIGQQLIAYLKKAPWCERIVGTDIVEPAVQSTKLTFINQDIRDPLIVELWRDHKVDTIVHLAFVLNPIHDEKKMFDINVNGTLNVLRACDELSIRHIIVASSGTAYGAWPDNPDMIREDDPIRLFPPTFSYAHHKGLVEAHCREYLQKHPDVILNVVRPCIVYGPNADNFLTRFLDNLPVLLLADGCDPDLQFVHETDVAEFFSLLIEKKKPGPFNVAGDGVVRLSEVGAMAGKKSLKIPKRLYSGLVGLLWRLRFKIVEAPSGIVDYIAYPWVLDTKRAKKELRWQPTYTSKETLRIMLETHGYRLCT
ncbi:MAG: SDR family oxidoreductase [Thermodesulfobacteriota bacterium]